MLIHSEVTPSVFRKLVLLDLLPHGLLPPTRSPPARQSDTQPQAGSFVPITWPLWSPPQGKSTSAQLSQTSKSACHPPRLVTARPRVSPALLLTPNFRLSIHHLMVNFGATAGGEKVRRNHSGTKQLCNVEKPTVGWPFRPRSDPRVSQPGWVASSRHPPVRSLLHSGLTGSRPRGPWIWIRGTWI